MSRNKIQLFRGTSTNRKTDTASKGQTLLDDGELFLETDTNILYSKHGASDAQLQHAKPMNLSDESRLGAKGITSTEYFNNTLSISSANQAYEFEIRFKLVGSLYTAEYNNLKIQLENRGGEDYETVLKFGNTLVYSQGNGWENLDYREIKFLEDISTQKDIHGEKSLIEWLNEYGVYTAPASRKISDIFEENSNAVKNATNAEYAEYAEYASEDKSKGTIEERLTNLGFKQGAIEPTHSHVQGEGEWSALAPAPSNWVKRQGNYAILTYYVEFTGPGLSFITSVGEWTTIGILSNEFKPKIGGSYSVYGWYGEFDKALECRVFYDSKDSKVKLQVQPITGPGLIEYGGASYQMKWFGYECEPL